MKKKNILKDSCKSAWIPVDQVLIVEGILRNSDEPIIKQSDLKADLPENIDNIALESILTYLESMHKIVRSKKGIMYVPEPSAKLKSALKKGILYDTN